jgi:UDP-N-acetylglucosamine 3-dehydrogenase
METVNVAVVGVGKMGVNHAAAYSRNAAARLRAVVDVREEVARDVAERFGVPAFGDVGRMLQEADVDAVSICTSDAHHTAPALACFAAGKHVLLEKPIATSLSDAGQIIEAAGEAGVKFLVGQIVRFDPAYAHVKTRLDSGELGELEAVFARRLNNVGSQEILGGRISVLSFLGVHDFDYVRWLAGSEPVRVHTESIAKVHKSAGLDVEDHTFTLIRFANGVIACVEAGWVLPDAHPRKADFKLEVIGTRGMAQVDLLGGGLAVCTERGWEVPPMGQALDAEIAHFIECILEDSAPLVSGEDGLAALRISLAAQESAKTGRTVEL